MPVLLVALHAPLSWIAGVARTPSFHPVDARRCAAPHAIMTPPNIIPALKDALMEKTISLQKDMFSAVGEKGLQLWLQHSWDDFTSRERPEHMANGQLTQFLDELQHSSQTLFYVAAHSFQQGSPNNPFLDHGEKGSAMRIEPPVIADKLMRVRNDVADRWRQQLQVIANGEPLDTSSPDAQLLAGLATRLAVSALMRDLYLLPSQAHVYEWLDHYVLKRSKDMEAGGDVEGMLVALASEPVRIRGRALLDPKDLTEQIRERRAEVAMFMIHELEDLHEEHREIKASFLEGCFKLQGL